MLCGLSKQYFISASLTNNICKNILFTPDMCSESECVVRATSIRRHSLQEVQNSGKHEREEFI